MLKELSEDLSSIKKIQSQAKNTLFEMNNLQRNNRRVNVNNVKNQINDLVHKEAKNNQSEQQAEKGIQNRRIV